LIEDGKKPDELKKKYSKELIKKSALLTLKPRIIVCNVDDKSLPDGNKYSDACKKKFSDENIIIVCADIEDQIMGLQIKDRKDFMLESGIKNTGLDNLIKTGYNTLGLSTFFTSGPEESRAWTIEKNSKKISIEASSIFGWEKYVGSEGSSLGMKSFGKSAPYKAIYENFNLTSDSVVTIAKKMLGK